MTTIKISEFFKFVEHMFSFDEDDDFIKASYKYEFFDGGVGVYVETRFGSIETGYFLANDHHSPYTSNSYPLADFATDTDDLYVDDGIAPDVSYVTDFQFEDDLKFKFVKYNRYGGKLVTATYDEAMGSLKELSLRGAFIYYRNFKDKTSLTVDEFLKQLSEEDNDDQEIYFEKLNNFLKDLAGSIFGYKIAHKIPKALILNVVSDCEKHDEFDSDCDWCESTKHNIWGYPKIDGEYRASEETKYISVNDFLDMLVPKEIMISSDGQGNFRLIYKIEAQDGDDRLPLEFRFTEERGYNPIVKVRGLSSLEPNDFVAEVTNEHMFNVNDVNFVVDEIWDDIIEPLCNTKQLNGFFRIVVSKESRYKEIDHDDLVDKIHEKLFSAQAVSQYDIKLNFDLQGVNLLDYYDIEKLVDFGVGLDEEEFYSSFILGIDVNGVDYIGILN